MNVPAGYRIDWEAEERRQAEIMAWELTFIQIQSLPVTTDCPPEELLTS